MKKGLGPSARIGARFRYVRERVPPNGLTQVEMAQRMGKSTSHYTKVESGHATFSEEMIDDLCNLFGVSKEWVLNGDGTPGQVRCEARPAETPSACRSDAIDGAIEATYRLMSDSKTREIVADLAQSSGMSELLIVKGLARQRMDAEGNDRG